MTDKVHVLPGGHIAPTSEEALNKLMAQLPTTVAYLEVLATLTRKKYQALVKEGFTPGEALALCKGPLV